jgi:hypothetical protein
MNDPIPSNQPGPTELMRLGHATRFAIACIVVGFSYLSIRSCLSIRVFGGLFLDFLGENEILPPLTRFILGARMPLLALSFSIPAASIALLFTRNIARSLYCLGVLALVSIIEWIVVYEAMFLPLTKVVVGMHNPSP